MFLWSFVVPLLSLCCPFVPVLPLCPDVVPLSLNECVGTKIWSQRRTYVRTDGRTYGRTYGRTSVRTYENWKACSRPALLGFDKNYMKRGQTHRGLDIATLWKNWPKGRFFENTFNWVNLVHLSLDSCKWSRWLRSKICHQTWR